MSLVASRGRGFFFKLKRNEQNFLPHLYQSWETSLNSQSEVVLRQITLLHVHTMDTLP